MLARSLTLLLGQGRGVSLARAIHFLTGLHLPKPFLGNLCTQIVFKS